MADLFDRSFSSSSSLESEDMSSFLQSFLNNASNKPKLMPYHPSPVSTDFVDLSSFYSSKTTNQVEKVREVGQNSNPTRSSKRTRAAEIHNLSEKRRRSRINEKLKALQTLVPNSNKTDKASMLDEAIEYLKQLQLKVQTLTMRNGYGLPPVYPQEQEMQRGIGFNEGYRLGNPSEGVVTFSQNEGFSMRREYDMPNHIGMSSLNNMMKPDPSFGSEPANENQYGFNNHSTSLKETNRPSKLPRDISFSGKGVSS